MTESGGTRHVFPEGRSPTCCSLSTPETLPTACQALPGAGDSKVPALGVGRGPAIGAHLGSQGRLSARRYLRRRILRLSGNHPGDKGIRGEEMLPEGTARVKVIGHETTWEVLRFICT